MASKCNFCKKKGKRFCVVLQENICSSCCGSKREREIECVVDCDFYRDSKIKENEKAALKITKETFAYKYDDFLKQEKNSQTAGPFEEFVFINYYDDMSVDDYAILHAYIKIYYLLQGEEQLYELEDYELAMYNKFLEVTRKNNISNENSQWLILKLIESINTFSNEKTGRREYLEMLRGMMTKTGRMGHLF